MTPFLYSIIIMPTQRDTVIFVCTANICRSPMAERLFAQALGNEEEPLNQLQVVSAGVSAIDGDLVSQNSIDAMSEEGIDIQDHRSQRLNLEMIQSAVAIFVMTESHRALIEMTYENLEVPVFLMREFIPEPATNQIPDPFGQSLEIYRLSRESMKEALPSLIEFLKKETEH